MGHAVPKDFAGRSLAPELKGGTPDNREPIVLDLPEDKNNPDRHAIISGDYKLIVKSYGATYLLFNLKNDPTGGRGSGEERTREAGGDEGAVRKDLEGHSRHRPVRRHCTPEWQESKRTARARMSAD